MGFHYNIIRLYCYLLRYTRDNIIVTHRCHTLLAWRAFGCSPERPRSRVRRHNPLPGHPLQSQRAVHSRDSRDPGEQVQREAGGAARRPHPQPLPPPSRGVPTEGAKARTAAHRLQRAHQFGLLIHVSSSFLILLLS